MAKHLYQHLQTLWDFHLMGHELKPADCLFIMCSNDLRVADYAAKLYQQGLAKRVLISGGEGRFTEGAFEKSEAETFADILIDEGVPESALILETQATNSGENVTLGYQAMKSAGFNFQSFILVQKPFMERRAYATFLKQWPTPVENVVVTSPPIPLNEYPTEDMPLDHVIHATIADFERVRDYPEKGFQIEQPIPEHVNEAYVALSQAGLTN